MKIISLTLSGFKRFRLNNIENFHIDFTQSLQLILGSNGSGKSSLLELLTPLPPNHQDFYKTGKKIITIEHNNSTYVLSSTFSPHKHSFLKDQIELNLGNTVTVQKELVYEHFGINQEIHDLIIGKISFTSLPANKRKEWFIKLCDTDYEYAIKIYNKIKEQHRDISGALKIAKKKLTVEVEKTIKTEEQIKLEQEVSELHKSLSSLLEIRKPIDKDYDSLELEQQSLDNYLHKLVRSLESIKQNIIQETLSTIELEDLIRQKDMMLFSINEQIGKITSILKDNQNKINILQRAEKATVQSLQSDIQTLQAGLLSLEQSTIAKNINDSKLVLNSYNSIVEQLNEIFTTIEANTDKKYSQEKLVLAKDELSTILVKKENILIELSSKKQKIKHMLEHKDKPNIQCPSCNHEFSTGYNQVEFDKLNLSISQLENILIENNKKIDILNTYIQECNNYALLYRQYIQISRSNPCLNEYWDYINEDNTVQNNPRSIVHKLNSINSDINKQIKLFDIKQELINKQKILDDIINLGTDDLNSLLKLVEQIDQELQELTNKHVQVQEDRKQLVNRKLTMLNYSDLTVKIRNTILKKKEISKEQIETLRRQYFNDSIRTIQSHLSSKETILHGITIQRSLITDLEKQILDMEKQELALSNLINHLSPTDGLIAEGLLGFINSFMAQMNHFIKKIWSYPLSIKTCSIQEGESIDLDYLFPMLVGGIDNEVSDVSKGSSAMLEIVNLAFRITAMQSLGLKHYPIALDEFAKTFDTVHRDAATYVIKTLVDQQIFNQVFVVSHYESIYGALPNSEICVLDSGNVALGKLTTSINKHVIIN